MKPLIYFSPNTILLAFIFFFGCSTAHIENNDAYASTQTKTAEQIETDDFVKLVEKHLDDLYRVEKQMTGDGYNERGEGTLAMYFQGDYVIKKEEHIEIDKVFYEEETYLYNLNPIYHVQKITYPNGKIENNQIYMQDRKITYWYRDGKLVTDQTEIQNQQQNLKNNYNRFR